MPSKSPSGQKSGQNGISLYAKIASVMRTQITQGELHIGQQLPSIEQLSAQYNVAAVTIRRAISILVTEGLLSSSRGRGTFVISQGAEESDFPRIYSTARARFMEATMLHRESGVELPRDFGSTHARLDSYEWMRKVHHNGPEMYFLMDAYVVPSLLPFIREHPGQGVMLIRSLADEFLRRRVRVVTTVRVGAADVEAAAILKSDIAFPMAQIRRLYVSRGGAILVASRASYRADIFEMHMDQTAVDFLSSRSDSSVKPSDAKSSASGGNKKGRKKKAVSP